MECNIRMNVREVGWGGVAGFIWLKVRTSGGLF